MLMKIAVASIVSAALIGALVAVPAFAGDSSGDPGLGYGYGYNPGVMVCHIPPGNPAAAHTITVGAGAVDAHLAHGDTLGPCATSPKDKVTLCHIPPGNPAAAHTITVGAGAANAHLAHGDTLEPCPVSPRVKAEGEDDDGDDDIAEVDEYEGEDDDDEDRSKARGPKKDSHGPPW